MEVDIVRKCLGKNVDEIVVPADIAKGPAKPFSAWPTCCNIRQVKLLSVTINLMAQDRKIKIIEDDLSIYRRRKIFPNYFLDNNVFFL